MVVVTGIAPEKRRIPLPVRIYALAKQLQVGSKELADLCKQVGVDVKGSALASLTDEEVELVKGALQKENQAKSGRPVSETSSTQMSRPSLSTPSGKIPVLKPPRLPKSPAELQSSASAIDEDAEVSTRLTEEAVVTKVATSQPVSSEEQVGSPTTDIVSSPSVEVDSSVIKETPIKESVAEEEKPTEVKSVDKQTQQTTGTVPGIKSTHDDLRPIPPVRPAPTAPIRPIPVLRPPNRPAPPPQISGSKGAEHRPPLASKRDETTHQSDSVNVVNIPSSESQVSVPPKSKQPEKSKQTGTGKQQEKSKQAPRVMPPTRPPVINPMAAIEEASRQAAQTMVRPPVHVAHPDEGRIVNLNNPSSKKKRDDSDSFKATDVNPNDSKPSDGSKGSNRPSGRPGPAIHLAPLPTAPTKQVAKQEKVEPAQKPITRYRNAEELLQAKEESQRPLSDILRAGREKKDRATSTPQSGQTGQAGQSGRGGEVRRRRPEQLIPAPVVHLPQLDDGKKGGKKGKARPADTDGRDDAKGKKSRQPERGRFRGRVDLENQTQDHHFHRHSRTKKGIRGSSTAPRRGDLVIEMPCTVKQFAESTGLSAAAIIKKLMELGYLTTINQSLDIETVELLVEAFDLKVVVRKERTLEEEFVSSVYDVVDSEESLVSRPPVVTFLGHVDHGKTSLLDRILKLDVVSGEKGGITQHIRAYRIATPSGDVTFVDTPGHEAFTEMRARGANCTDIAVLVVAADDGVMPQTEEAISHARAAEVPIVVALNKIDLPGVNRDRIIQELATNDLMPVEWGGDVEIVETSALTGFGIDDLMQTLLTIAELREIKANPDRSANGIALESSLLPDQGVVCKVLVQNGTLRPGDVVLCGNAFGRVKAMFDTLDANKVIKEAGPGTPISLLGLNIAPGAGSKFVVLDDVSTARQIAEERTRKVHELELADLNTHVTLENLFDRISGSKKQQTLNIIIRADVRGSIEAIRKELSKLEHPEVKVKILQASVGGITEADVHLADASDAIIVGFSVVPDEGARSLAERKKVQVRRYDIIYKLTEDIRNALEGMLKPAEQVKELGRAVVQRTFVISRVGTIAGCRITSGTVERDARVRLIRDSRVIGEYTLDTLRREKDDAREVREGYECGIKLKGYNDIKEGDIFEAYKIEEIARTF